MMTASNKKKLPSESVKEWGRPDAATCVHFRCQRIRYSGPGICVSSIGRARIIHGLLLGVSLFNNCERMVRGGGRSTSLRSGFLDSKNELHHFIPQFGMSAQRLEIHAAFQILRIFVENFEVGKSSAHQVGGAECIPEQFSRRSSAW